MPAPPARTPPQPLIDDTKAHVILCKRLGLVTNNNDDLFDQIASGFQFTFFLHLIQKEDAEALVTVAVELNSLVE
jgi:hypothetical protein